MKIDNATAKLISGLQKMPENELTKNIIIPLLESLGFLKVEFYGGSSEEGKDIVCWEIDKMQDLKLIVAQVKHFKFSNKASNPNSLQTVINQLTTCFKKSLPFSDQTFYLPSEVYLISTYIVDTKSLQTRFSQYPDLRDQKIKIIDGFKLATLLLKNNPSLVKSLIGLDIEIHSALKSTLNNEILLKALGFNKKKDIQNIYIDIDFSLGKVTTELFFNSVLKPVNLTLNLDESDWELFKNICTEIECEFNLNFLHKTLSQIENDNKNSQINHGEWKKKLSRLTEKLNDIKHNSKGDINKIKELTDEINSLTKSEPTLLYEVTLDGFNLADQIHIKRKWIENRVKEINHEESSLAEIKGFIIKSKQIIDAASHLFTYHQYFSCLGFDKKNILRSNFDTTRFKLPIQKIFDTGLNIAVFGEAGAGKSTSLQMYALNGDEKGEKLLICLPLTNLLQNWQQTDSELTDELKGTKLDEAIVNYLQQKGISISLSEFQLETSLKNTVLLLDGIDEAIKSSPWLPKAITFFSNQYKSIQVIVTSRMSGSYINEIPFFTVTLLPFTEEQRNLFIDKWFGEEERDIVQKIKAHLKKNKTVSDTIRNPLLTTTLCVLAKSDIELPNTEIKLYNDRMKLLTGYYDRVKNIDVRITSTPQTLETVAQKIAFYLHVEGKREEDVATLKKQAVRLMLNVLSISDAENAISELIDPCNVLVPITDDGKFGFGHLRYQEHLVAKEISTNRSVDILPLLKQSWWRGPLVLFSQMSVDLKWLVQSLGERVNVASIKEGLTEMIKVRPKNEQINLNGLIESYLKLDKLDDESEEINED